MSLANLFQSFTVHHYVVSLTFKISFKLEHNIGYQPFTILRYNANRNLKVCPFQKPTYFIILLLSSSLVYRQAWFSFLGSSVANLWFLEQFSDLQIKFYGLVMISFLNFSIRRFVDSVVVKFMDWTWKRLCFVRIWVLLVRLLLFVNPCTHMDFVCCSHTHFKLTPFTERTYHTS